MSSIPTPTIPLQLSAASVDELKGLGEMLQRIFVRNKNQHRRSHWWKALKGFKRELGLVLGELAALQTATSTSTSNSNSKPALTRRLEARLRVLSEEKMHAWYM
jgi:ribonuclease MRP protein subunit RMP1